MDSNKNRFLIKNCTGKNKMYSSIEILILRLEFIQDCLNLINYILYSDLSKDSSIIRIKELLDKINIVSEIDDIINNI